MKTNKETIFKIVFRDNIFKFIELGILMLVSTMLSLKLSVELMEIVDHVIPDNSVKKLLGAIFAYILLSIGQEILYLVQGYLQMTIGLKLGISTKPIVMDKILRQSGDYFVENSGGELFQLIMNDVDKSTSFVVNNILSFCAMFISFCTAVVYLFILNWKLCIIILLFQPLSLLLNRILTPRLTKYSEMQRNVSADYVLSVNEVVGKPINLIISGLKDKCVNRMDNKMLENYRFTKKMALVNMLSSHLASIIQTLTLCAVVGYGGYCIITGDMSIGMLMVFMTYSNRLECSFEAMWSIMLDYAEIKPICNRVNRYFSEPVKDRTGKIYDHNTPDIEFRNVSFSYDESKKIYSDMSYTFSYGKKYGIIGKTGEGKSTLVKLIYNLWDVQGGHVRIGGSDCYDIDPKEVSQVLSYVAPDSMIVHDTIYNNVILGNENVSKEEVCEALKKVCLYDEVMEMENGLDTVLGDNGVSISSGQQQRLMLARAIVADKKIIILDEPTSALDVSTEKSVMKSIYENFADRLLIIISHNKAVLNMCDEVVRLKEGKFQQVEA